MEEGLHRAIDEAILEDGVAVQIDEQEKFSIFLAFGNKFFEDVNFRENLLLPRSKLTIEILTHYPRSIVAHEDSIDIQHRQYL